MFIQLSVNWVFQNYISAKNEIKQKPSTDQPLETGALLKRNCEVKLKTAWLSKIVQYARKEFVKNA